MSALQPVIKWSGSKRSQADEITKRFPGQFKRYYEPFLGGGSILGYSAPTKAVCGDICAPLVDLWKLVQHSPKEVADEYGKRWLQLQNKGPKIYYKIREDFNTNKSPHDLLFLSRTCVNGLIRFNQAGEFNNSFHLSRKGIHPERLKLIVSDWSTLVRGYKFIAGDYRMTTVTATKGDLVYLDPPYFHTRGRYFGTIKMKEFLDFLEDLNKRGVWFVLSFDGTRGNKVYTVDLPKELYKRQFYVHSGNSTFNKTQKKRTEPVFESLYMNY